MTTISIALCTCNGERYLSDQLDSLARQERLPDEVVICDDGSTDATVMLVGAFRKAAPFPVHIEINPTPLGTTKNFEQAIRLASSEVIALADQDDVWRPDKLARLEQTFREFPAAGLVFSDANLVDANRTDLGYSLWEAVPLGLEERKGFRHDTGFTSLLRRWRVTGATMALRAALKPLILPIPDDWHHDAWISLLIAGVAPVVPIEEPLIQYRQHAGQQIGQRKRGWYQEYLVARAMRQASFRALAQRFTQAHDRLRSYPGVPSERLAVLAAKIAHCQQRARLRDHWARRLPTVWREAWRGNYFRYSYGWKAIAQDLFLP